MHGPSQAHADAGRPPSRSFAGAKLSDHCRKTGAHVRPCMQCAYSPFSMRAGPGTQVPHLNVRPCNPGPGPSLHLQLLLVAAAAFRHGYQHNAQQICPSIGIHMPHNLCRGTDDNSISCFLSSKPGPVPPHSCLSGGDPANPAPHSVDCSPRRARCTH